MKLIVVLYNYLKTPNLKLKKVSRKELFIGFKEFIVFDLALAFIWGLIITLLTFLFDDLRGVMKSTITTNHSFFLKILKFSIIIPLIEELSFRLGLKITKINISISLGIQIIIILQLLNIIESPLYARIIWMVTAISALYLLLKKKHISFFKKNYNFFVYYNILFFGILHICNYHFTSYTQYFFIPILISLHVIFGSYMSYSRMKYGFAFTLFIHGFHNFVIILLGFLFKGDF
tara:strand:- start:1081 stop:1779 length:699 start_codon:yes stop_codon:yes gene_type:complete